MQTYTHIGDADLFVYWTGHHISHLLIQMQLFSCKIYETDIIDAVLLMMEMIYITMNVPKRPSSRSPVTGATFYCLIHNKQRSIVHKNNVTSELTFKTHSTYKFCHGIYPSDY